MLVVKRVKVRSSQLWSIRAIIALLLTIILDIVAGFPLGWIPNTSRQVVWILLVIVILILTTLISNKHHIHGLREMRDFFAKVALIATLFLWTTWLFPEGWQTSLLDIFYVWTLYIAIAAALILLGACWKYIRSHD